MSNKRNGTLYIGVTSDLERRVQQHKLGTFGGFTSRYGLTLLVWYQRFESITEAIYCEKRMKEWHRAWKLRAIEAINPNWRDLSEDWTEGGASAHWTPACAGVTKDEDARTHT